MITSLFIICIVFLQKPIVLLKKELNTTEFLSYVAAQLLGGASAVYAYKML
jgi:hypothetical protein